MTERRQKIIHYITWCSMGALLAFTIYGMKSGILTDRSQMEALVSKCGIYGRDSHHSRRRNLCGRGGAVWSLGGTSL